MISKLDIAGLIRKGRPATKKFQAKREVVKTDLVLVSTAKTAAKKEIIPEKFSAKEAYVFSYGRLAPFLAVSLILVLAIQAIGFGIGSLRSSQKQILGLSVSAYEEIASAQESFAQQDFIKASALFGQASDQLSQSLAELNQYYGLGLISPKARSVNAIISAAKDLAEAAKNVSEGMRLFDELKVSGKGVETDNFDQRVLQNLQLMREANTLLERGNSSLDKADNIPSQFGQSLSQAKEMANKLKVFVSQIADLEDLYLSMFSGIPKTYLLIFPNPNEIRATGGFIGTYGVLRVTDAKIEKLKIQSIYDFDGSFNSNLASPGPLQPDIPKWGLRDSNWFADFPTSAAKMMMMFEKGSQTVDGVISLSPAVFEELLKVTGPVEMAQYSVTLTSENFAEIVQRKTSVDYDRELNQPKKFLDDFTDIFLDRLLNLDRAQWLDVFGIVRLKMTQRDILAYSQDRETQKKLGQMGLDGRILDTDKDYLSIVNSNLSGTKTDSLIKQSIKLNSTLVANGTITDFLTIQRENPTDETNNDFVRVLVPKGSKLLTISSTDSTSSPASRALNLRTDPDLAILDRGEEAGKTSFSFWINLPPKTTKQVKLVYVLPFKLENSIFNRSESYSLLFQKQPGSSLIKFSSSLKLDGFSPVWLSGASYFQDVIEFNSESVADDFWSVVLKDNG
ncbi:MAG: DUF4012 domain-containing protein [Candidatus Doudnabacteria bacterium]|nr:DUF4012 domain-containing protein [Candidatus Doudnabacteria bacterium]